MKIVFVSGFLNNHLLPLCEALSKQSAFVFIATEQRSAGSLENRDSIDRDYVLYDFDNDDKPKCNEAIEHADVVICGGSSKSYLDMSKSYGKIVFIYSERVFKKGRIRRFYPPTRKTLRDIFIKDNNNTYVLCASSFLADDIALLGFPKGRCYKLGYLPYIRQLPLQTVLENKDLNKDCSVNLLYVGRLLKLKKVDVLLRACRLMDENHIQYKLNIVGDGPERANLENLTRRLKLQNVVFHGAKPIETVYEYMLKSNILYLTSNHYEGWGAVVNEALGHGCIVIETSTCGSARYLIKDGVNGYTCRQNSSKDIYLHTREYINVDSLLKKEMHASAYATIWKEWNANIASSRFIDVAEKLLDGEMPTEYQRGPLSKD